MLLSEEQIEDCLNKWRYRFHLSDLWEFSIILINESKNCNNPRTSTQAHVKVKEAYFRATFTFHAWLIEDEKELNLVCCHEVLHVLKNRSELMVYAFMEDDASDLARITCENEVEHLSRAFVELEEGLEGKPTTH